MDSRNEKAFGYDMYSNEIRREAMDTARDTGMTTISRRVVLVQEIDNSDIQAGFLMYLPLYQKGADSTTLESRKDSLRGFVYSPFRANDLLDGLLGDTFQTLSMRIYDSNILEDDYLLYDSISKKSRLNTNAIFKDTITLELQNRTWSIEFFSTPHFESLINSSQPAIVGFVGFTIDIILFFMVHFLIKTKSDLEEQQELLISQSRLSAMGEMIGNIAHQWRQPLNSINLGIYIIDELVDEASEKHKLEDCQIKDYTKSILDTTEYLSKTIDEFRNFFETKQERENFTVSTVINDTISLLSPQFKAVNITISFTNISTYETIYSYSTKFKQVLLNILNNSKDAILMEQKENRVNIGMIHITLSEDENSIIIEIEDNGGGIDSDIIDKIYEPYFTTKFASRGKGLGLYMSKMIIERHMFGTLSSKNKENGSIFIIKIPILNKT
jgi:signal transduction histidine kinase